MTEALARVRDAALVLPETSEATVEGCPTFLVADRPFVQVRDDAATVCVQAGSSDERVGLTGDPDADGWIAIGLTGDVDWPLVEDRIARSWELTAPRRLLEAGGR
ncbi:hypothetical protein ASE75_06450 [Sphingomonas sp. Leaf17]|uniref:MmcQ/YjbR family DNA-binding protein n=1 Tax=Sphingomonas sp. Leaf17 TaxID=1735683 RepID=UPI0006F40D3A|nr:MmcQ/YjbR family DNA-binding protein [Sphingomonas sp. Leaf17]KQM65865.1 hypothetical protein ASE75_06450 [Sphingomonas sp. Leaf17]